MPDAIHQKRRACDSCGNDGHESPCEKLQLTATIQDQMFAMLEDIQRENAKQSKILDDQKDVFAAMNATKGFYTTMKTIGVFLVWVTVVGGALALIIHSVRDAVFAGVITK